MILTVIILQIGKTMLRQPGLAYIYLSFAILILTSTYLEYLSLPYLHVIY